VTGIDVSNPREQKLKLTLHGQPLVVQLGPVMRGNAIRDASGFKFEDFTNQVQFAQLSRAYNREAIKQLPKVDASWTGKPVDILFAVTVINGSLQDAAALQLKQEAR
jgi:predicted lipoprotein